MAEALPSLVESGYAPVNGLTMYYEIHGVGSVPLLLLHGSLGSLEMFRDLLPALSRDRRVVAIDQQGHGRTADIDRPLRYEQLADDAAAVLRFLGIDRADIFGYSMGAGAALQLAIRHPERVRKLVNATATYTNAHIYTSIRKSWPVWRPSSRRRRLQALRSRRPTSRSLRAQTTSRSWWAR